MKKFTSWYLKQGDNSKEGNTEDITEEITAETSEGLFEQNKLYQEAEERYFWRKYSDYRERCQDWETPISFDVFKLRLEETIPGDLEEDLNKLREQVWLGTYRQETYSETIYQEEEELPTKATEEEEETSYTYGSHLLGNTPSTASVSSEKDSELTEQERH
jgi:hypothetical protein